MSSITIDPKAVYPYLGMAGKLPDPALEEQVSFCIQMIEQVSMPRSVYRNFPLHRNSEGCHVVGTSLLLTGADIFVHLTDCQDVLLMAVTLGNGVEKLLMRTQVNNVANAMIMDACASAAVEAAADALTAHLQDEYEKKGLYLTRRFSPGYGDLPIELQENLLTVLNTQRTIGLTASNSSILLPRKSITAVLGISDSPHSGKLAGCANCTMNNKCLYRKEGTTCEH